MAGSGGWAYRQFADGSIYIVTAPAGSTARGKTLTSGTAWAAITKEIGPYRAPATPAAALTALTGKALALSERMARAWVGDLTEGGCQDPREAAAWVFGYVTRRYIPGRQQKSKISAADASKLLGIAMEFQRASMESGADAAWRKATTIQNGGAVGILKTYMSRAFEAISEHTLDKTRVEAVEVLQHAASVFSAAGHPLVAEKCALAADTTTKATHTVFQAAAAGAAAVANAVMDAPKAAGTAVGTAMAGAANTVGAATAAAKEVVEREMDRAQAAAGKLAQAGAGEVKERLEDVRNLAEKAGSAVGAAKDEAKERLAAAGTALRDGIHAVADKGTALQQKVAGEVGDAFEAATRAAGAARDAAANLPGMLVDAARDRLLDPALDRLSPLVQGALDDPCRLLPGQTAEDRCRAVVDKAAKVGADPCSLLPGPAAWACRNPGKTAAGIGGVLLIVPLLFFFLGRRGGGAPRQITEQPAPRPAPRPRARPAVAGLGTFEHPPLRFETFFRTVPRS